MAQQNPPNPPPAAPSAPASGGSTADRREAEIQRRRDNGAQWLKLGFLPYGNDTGPLDRVADIEHAHAGHDAAALESGEHAGHVYRVAGRVMLSRDTGKLRFVTLRDGSGEIQLFISKKDCDPVSWQVLDYVDLGDVVLAEGPPMRTRTGQLSIKTTRVRPLTKAQQGPAKHDPNRATEVGDVEDRYRMRYRDLIDNHDKVADVFRARAVVVTALREFYDSRGFMEVETPMLQSVRGGATARPFTTHHNTLDLDLYLRIAPELFLKRLVVGGFDRVYEIGRAFRNEGISTRHNPEFTILESYQAYATYEDLMRQTEEMFEHVNGRVLERFPKFAEGRGFSLARPFARVRMTDAVRASLAKRDPTLAARWSLLGGEGGWEDIRTAILEGEGAGVSPDERAYVSKCRTAGELLFALYEIFAEKHLVEDYRTADGSLSVPVFVVDYPFDVSPLARCKDAAVQRAQYGEIEIALTDRFELFVHGRELCNAFSELNDPDDQAERFLAQVQNRERGDEEAMDNDLDYVNALRYGMPPAAGFGLGVDRLTMALTGAESIRDVILFPLLRPAKEAGAANEEATLEQQVADKLGVATRRGGGGGGT